MTIKEPQLSRCHEVMKEINSMAISKMFAQSVDPVRDNCPDYLTIVKNPMDLGTIVRKLNDGEYKSVEDWRTDCELVWSNSLLYNQKNSIMLMITTHMQLVFRKLSQNLSDDTYSDWSNTLNSMKDEFVSLVKRSSDFHRDAAGNRKSSTKSKSSKSSKSSSKSILPEKPPKKTQTISREFVIKLTEDINMLNSEPLIRSIIDILRQYEPVLARKSGDQLEIDMNSLQPITLRALRDKVDSFLLEQQ